MWNKIFETAKELMTLYHDVGQLKQGCAPES